MRLAIPIFRTRISPVLDFPTKVLIIDIEQGNETGRHEINLSGLPPPARLDPERCTGCGSCVAQCPQGALTLFPIARHLREKAGGAL